MPKQLSYESNGKYDRTLAIGFLIPYTRSFIEERKKQIISTIKQSIGLLREIQQFHEKLAINVGVLLIGKNAKELDWVTKGFLPVEQADFSALSANLVGTKLEEKDIGVSGFEALNDLLSLEFIPAIMPSGAYPPVDFSFILISGADSSSAWQSGLSSIKKNEYFSRASKISVPFEEPASDFARSFTSDEPVSPLALSGELLKLFPQDNEIQHPVISWAVNEDFVLTEPVMLHRCEIMSCEPEHATDPVVLLCPYNNQILACVADGEFERIPLELCFTVPGGSSRSFPYSDEDTISTSTQAFSLAQTSQHALRATIQGGKITLYIDDSETWCVGRHEKFDHRWFSLIAGDELKSATGKTILSIKQVEDPWDADDAWG